MRYVLGIALILTTFVPGMIIVAVPQKPAFDVADVRAIRSSTELNMRIVLRTGGRYEVHNATMLDLIRTAYGVDADNVGGGPSWLEFDRFDVTAKVPSKTPPETLNLMLQALLADRFSLVVHSSTKPISRLVLGRSNGTPKLKQATQSEKTGCQTQPGVMHVVAGQLAVDPTTMSCHNVTMDAFASLLQTVAPAYFSTPVIDMTGLKGSWDFELKWMAKSALSEAGAGAVSVFEAVDNQLGLKLEERQVASPVLVVDSVNEKPTDNAADIAIKLPALPTRFEVMDIKPVAPGTRPFGGPMRFSPGGRFSAGLALRYTILRAWNLTSIEQIAGAPKWLTQSEPQFDMDVEVPQSILLENGRPDPFQDLAPMLQNMLKERFKMKSHFEDQLVTAYTLVAVKPKLKTASSGRTKCRQKDIRRTNGAGTRPSWDRAVTCQNMTMAQFADQLQAMSVFAETPSLAFPVLDATHLDGASDFTFTFTPGQSSPGPITSDAVRAGGPVASDPTGDVSLFDAIEKQLGLALRMEKRVYPLLVIDHLDEKPTEN